MINPLKNLDTSILLCAFRKFINEVGIKPTLIRTDYGTKLMGGQVLQYLEEQQIKVEAAPPKRQHQNGLVERN